VGKNDDMSPDIKAKEGYWTWCV